MKTVGNNKPMLDVSSHHFYYLTQDVRVEMILRCLKCSKCSWGYFTTILVAELWEYTAVKFYKYLYVYKV